MRTSSFTKKFWQVVRIRREHTAVALAVGLLVAFVPGQLLAKQKAGAKNVCGSAYQGAKERMQAAQLLEAKALLEKCVQESCGNFLRQECTALYTQLDRDVPSVVPVVTDDKGTPVALVEVRMDGTLLTSRLDGLAVQVDPGKHEFAFSNDTGVFATKRIMIAQGERNRTISVQIHSPKDRVRANAVAGAAKNPERKPLSARKQASAPIAQSETVGAKAQTPVAHRYE